MECNIRNSSKRNQSYRPVSLLISRILEKRKKCLETKCYFYKPILDLKCLSKRKHKKVETRIKKVYLEWFSKWILRNNKTLVSISCGFWSDWIACTSYATSTSGILWNIAVADPNLELSGDGDRGRGGLTGLPVFLPSAISSFLLAKIRKGKRAVPSPRSASVYYERTFVNCFIACHTEYSK